MQHAGCTTKMIMHEVSLLRVTVCVILGPGYGSVTFQSGMWFVGASVKNGSSCTYNAPLWYCTVHARPYEYQVRFTPDGSSVHFKRQYA